MVCLTNLYALKTNAGDDNAVLQPVNSHNVLLLLAIQLLDDEDDDDAIRDQQQGLLLLDEHNVLPPHRQNPPLTQVTHKYDCSYIHFNSSVRCRCVPKYIVYK